ncbi:hypothetical protein COY07_02445 [Candidatus Peregrinibacteria bacterium CG_4_10_14_0_2_um_filter_43_11]|nr:MAG: hypothetical protein COY07_02445 [Candidatus Peregrinibacteria bacterium CG_4_10_14_0_2_um_filter_43_11]
MSIQAKQIPAGWKKELQKETAIVAYLDLSNMFHWQKVLRWRFRFEDVVSELFAIHGMKEVRVYYGLDERNLKRSQSFHKRIRKTGAILKAKPVKYIKKTIGEALLFKERTLTLFDDGVTIKLKELVEEVQKSGILIEEPKCNFDVEMTMDILDDLEKVSAIMLFSGDSDFHAPLERLKVKGKRIYVVGVRGQTSKELFEICNRYINFGHFYQGKKNRPYSENPTTSGGTA